jgi:hypothetical protein
MQWLGTSKYTILLILLKFQNLWNLINVLIKNFKNIYLNGYSDFSKVDGSKKIKVWHFSGTTQGWDTTCEQTIGVDCNCKCNHRNSSLDTCIKLLYLYFTKTIFHLSFVTNIGNLSFATRLIFSHKFCLWLKFNHKQQFLY